MDQGVPQGSPPTVRVVRRQHAWEGQPLELMGWMRRRGRLELILILADGSHLMVPAAWTDLQAAPEPIEAGTLGSLPAIADADPERPARLLGARSSGR